MPLRIGDTFAGYRVLRLLGSGGMGEVYLVQHPRLPRQEALKVLRPEFSRDASFRERFIREADLAAGLRHPHIVGIHDRGEHDGQLWIAMDYIEGTDLSSLARTALPSGHASRPRHNHHYRRRQCAGLRPQERSAAPRRQARQHHRRRPRYR